MMCTAMTMMRKHVSGLLTLDSKMIILPSSCEHQRHSDPDSNACK
jgi:hypothetical protein